MRLDVLDAETLARVGWVDVWVSLYWDSPYYSEGSFTLEVRPTAENLQLLQEGRWLVRSDENPRIPMRICSRANQNDGRKPCGVRLPGNVAADQAGVCGEHQEPERGSGHAQPCERR